MRPPTTSTSPATRSPVDEGGFDAEPHVVCSSASAMLRPELIEARLAPSPRRRRRESRRSRHAHRRRRHRERRRLRRTWRSSAAPTIRRTRSRSLSFAATTSTMRLPYVFPRRIIEIGRDGVEHELLRRPGLESRRAGEELRADDDRDLVVDECAEWRAGYRDDAGGERASFLRCLEGTKHVGGASARADADDGVGRGDLARQDVCGAGLAVVLRGNLGERGRGLASRDEGADESRGSGERRFALRCVERGDPPGRACSDVDEPAAVSHAARRSRRSRRRSRTMQPRPLRAPSQSNAFMSSTSSAVSRRS